MKTLLSLFFALFSAISFGQINAQVGKSEPTVSKAVKLQPKIRIIDGSFYTNLKSDKINESTIQSNLNEWLGLSADYTFIQFSTNKDELGITHQNFQQFYKGILVDGSAVLLHAKDGIANSINGMISDIEGFEIRSSITAAVAKNKAMIELNATKLINDYPIETVIMKHNTERASETKLAFKVRIDASDPIQMVEVFVDANSGEILQKINLIAHADEPGTGQTVYRGQKAITVDSNAGAYRLRDAARNIQTYDATGATFANNIGFQNYNDFTNPTANFSIVNPALDVHWGMEKTYDFYRTTFNRNSYDNLGSPIKNFVNGTMAVANTQNNAFAYPPPYNVMVYGLGDGTAYGAWVGLDVTGHEFTHMIVQHNGNGGLTYQGESGALNESFADIFGTAVEFYADPNANWTVTEGVVLTAPFYLRSLSNPNSSLTPQPDTYQGTYWMNPNSNTDYGGVHRNSGVQNFWFYLLCQGGTGTNDVGYAYNVPPIGMEKALKIAYRSLNNYLPIAARHGNARDGSLQATEDLYGATSAEYAAVVEAWNAVNVAGAPPALCSGTTNLTAATGSFSDNSGALPYENNADCKWLIAPAGAQQITLNFTAFHTDYENDVVRVYDGPDISAPLLGTYMGLIQPAAISTSVGVGAMLIRFTSNHRYTAAGWAASYSSIGTSTCVENATFTSASGSFNDGSGSNNYGNNQKCQWLIAPTCAETVVLSFSELETELNFDKILIYDDAAATNLIATVSGTTLPAYITSSTGLMVVHFETDYRNPMQGFTANYTSTGNATGATPTFNAVAGICAGTTLSALPTTSLNGITGTWSPALNNMATTIYNFTPDAGGPCAATATMIITVTPIVTPTFTAVAAICSGTPLSELPTSSLNGITGTWSPALDNTATTTYTFTPTAGQCATSKTMTITVNPTLTPIFTAVAPICSGASLSALPSSSTNGIVGTWSPMRNNTATTTYTFTPNAGQCSVSTTMTITVKPKIAPIFTPVAAFCSDSSLTALPTTSLNGVTGTWYPVLNDTITTTYTFFPDFGECAEYTTMTIPVNSSVTPTFSAFAPICYGTSLPPLPSSSLNGIFGNWSPELNNTMTTTYTFTPAEGQCAESTTVTIPVNSSVTPTFNAVEPICSGATLPPLPASSNNGIVGTWSPALNNMETTVYTFLPTPESCANSVTMTITVGGMKTWSGSPPSWKPCIPSPTDDAVIAADYSEDTNLIVNSLTVNNNATASIPSGYNLVLTAILTVEEGSNFTLENNAHLLQTTTSANNGSVIVKRNSAELFRQDYTLWSSPVSGQNLRAFSPQTLYNRFSSYDAAVGTNGDYVQEIFTVNDMNTKTFGVAKGYLIRMPNNWVAWNNINGANAQSFQGAFEGTITNGNVNVALSGANGKLNLVGNPYPSPISIADFFTANSNIDETLYFWRKKASASYSGVSPSGYATYTPIMGLTSADASIVGSPTNIETGQGFFVIANSATAGNLTFTNTMRNSGAATFYKGATDATNELHRMWLNLSTANNVVGQTLIGYATGATQGIDNGYDAAYLNDSPLALTSLINSSEYIIQGRAVPFTDTDIVPLGFKTEVAGTFTISLANFDGLFANSQDIFLKDNSTNTFHNLKTAAYSFASQEGVYNDRFEVQYANSTLSTTNPTLDANSILVAVKNQQIKINAGTIVMDKIELIDVAGRIIYKQENINATSAKIDNLAASNQMLIVRITTTENGVVNHKIVF